MSSVRLKPGYLSKRAFDYGALAAALLAVAALGAVVYFDALSPAAAAMLAVVGFPPYLLAVACGLGVWLGFGEDARAQVRRRRPQP